MWVFTEFGILMPSIRPTHTIAEGDDHTMQIRTRRRYELDHLRERYMPETLGGTIFLGNADYQYRAYCTPQAWADAIASMSLDIDYTKFKPTTDRHPGGKKLHDLYNIVWGKVLDAFPSGSSYDIKTSKLFKKYKNPVRTPWWEDAGALDMCGKPIGKRFCAQPLGHKHNCNPLRSVA
jgi:hypothetical protein